MIIIICRLDAELLFSQYGDHIKFNIDVPWNETSVDELNNLVEGYVEDGHLLCDIRYELVGCNMDKQEVTVRVVVNDMSEYFHPDNQMDDDQFLEEFSESD